MIRTTTVRVVTWNLWHRFGPWKRRQAAIVATLRLLKADVICLQEVWRDRENRDFGGALANELGMECSYTYCWTLGELDVGNAVLSSWPIKQQVELLLPGPVTSTTPRRLVTWTQIAGPRGELPVYVTHLAHDYHDSALRQEQVRSIAGFVAETANCSFPPVIGGDLNADPSCDEIRMLTGRTSVPVPGLFFHDVWDVTGRGPGITWSNGNPHARTSLAPDRRIDYVLVGASGPEGVGHPVAASVAGSKPVDGMVPSDHYAVVADLRY